MSPQSQTPLESALREAYRRGEDDETLEPMVLVDKNDSPIGRIKNGDYVIFYDIRGEREIELTEAFVSAEFPHFHREPITSHWVTMIEYHPSLNVRVAYPPIGLIHDTLSETLSKAGKKQVKIVESEKRVHLTHFMNGKRNDPFPGEEWKIIPSLEFEGYLPPPEMRAEEIANAALEAMENTDVDLIVVNFANVDVIGHSENRDAILTAVSTVDKQVGRIIEKAKELGIVALVTADHGTVEKWYYPDGSIDTGHTDSLVPFVYISPSTQSGELRHNGSLIDVAPTVLEILRLETPDAMTGKSLLLNPNRKKEHSRVVLLILDGWGARQEPWGNLILESNTPIMDELQRAHNSTTIEAAGDAVGLPNNVPGRPGKTVGNSEVGHIHLGSGRVIPSDRLRIENAIINGTFYQNESLRWAMEGAKNDGTNLHLIGIISFYSSHGSVEHLKALTHMAHELEVPQVYIHGMLGRRGEKPESGAIYVGDVETECMNLGSCHFVSLIGRFWSLDREENWDRIEKSYRWLVQGEGLSVCAHA